MVSTHRQQFFDTAVHHPKVKDCMSGQNELNVIEIFNLWGYKLGKDYVRQHPIGDRFVLDFAFVKEKIAIEVDGKGHLVRKQRKLDRKRDNFLYCNNWVVIRIPDQKFFENKSYYKYLIKEVVDARREQYEGGRLYDLDIRAYNEYDY